MYPLSPYLDLQSHNWHPTIYYNYRGTVSQDRAPVASGLHGVVSKEQLRARVSTATPDYSPATCTAASRITQTLTRADQFLFATLDTVTYAPHQYLAGLL